MGRRLIHIITGLNTGGAEKDLYRLLCSLEMIWSIGTINWGTAIRHHLPVWGLLLLAAYAASDIKMRMKTTTQNLQRKIKSVKA